MLFVTYWASFAGVLCFACLYLFSYAQQAWTEFIQLIKVIGINGALWHRMYQVSVALL